MQALFDTQQYGIDWVKRITFTISNIYSYSKCMQRRRKKLLFHAILLLPSANQISDPMNRYKRQYRLEVVQVFNL